MKYHRLLIAACFAFALPMQVFSEPPVVDESENFALIDEQQVATEQPVVHENYKQTQRDEETALAGNHYENGNGNNAILLDKIQGLQQEVQELRGQLEIQAHDLKLLQEQQLAFYKDLDARVPNEPLKTAKKEPLTDLTNNTKEAPNNTAPSPLAANKATAPVANIPANTVNRSNPADEQISYMAAYELVKNKKFDDALTAMQTFVAKHPQSGYTANAQYWLGELFMVKQSYPEAIEHFEVVLQQYPTSSKTAASMLKVGYALAAAGKTPEAIQRLEQVVATYPHTNTAQLAKVKLASLSH